ncbi:hypothetical protein [Candidatus Poriferisocius sp.]|uniref:hypothetical protein n=1 Tax=Candidatus Poriferisocius sp. TaxID=3101276 RepID=UPI003B51AC4F
MGRSVAKLLVHPGIWLTALRVGWRLRAFPDPAYLKFRMVTMYGDAHAQPRPDDLVTYLRWCKEWERSR